MTTVHDSEDDEIVIHTIHSSPSEATCQPLISAQVNTWKVCAANELKIGDLLEISAKEIVCVEDVRKPGGQGAKQRSYHNGEVNVSGKNVSKNGAFAQHKLQQGQQVKVLKNANVVDLPIVAFEPEEGKIYVLTAAQTIEEIDISNKSEEFEAVSNNACKALAKCVHCNGSLQLLAFFLKI